MKKHGTVKTLATLLAATGMLGLGGVGQKAPMIAGNSKITMASRHSARNLMLAGGARSQRHAGWPFKGKNRTQRANLRAAFYAMT